MSRSNEKAIGDCLNAQHDLSNLGGYLKNTFNNFSAGEKPFDKLLAGFCDLRITLTYSAGSVSLFIEGVLALYSQTAVKSYEILRYLTLDVFPNLRNLTKSYANLRGVFSELTKSYANLRGGVSEPLYRGFFGSVQPDGCEILRNLMLTYAAFFPNLRNLTLTYAAFSRTYEILR